MSRTASKIELSEEDIEFIIANTDFEREKILAWFNEFKKACPTGKLDKQTFIYFYKQLIKGDHEHEDQFCSLVFDVFDSDQNGSIDFGEFLIAFWVRAKGNIREKLAWVFDIYDSDNNNYITKHEMMKILRLVFAIKGIEEDSDDKTEEIFESLDRSNDGRLTKHEFIAGCMRNEELKALFAPF